MDKQIIIDGVDVSWCPYYIHKDGSCSSHDCECVKCVHNVCFYKDYKAKEQECEKKSWEIGNLGYKIKNQRKEINIRLEQLDQLKAENEELKKQNNQFDNGINKQFSKIVELEGRNNLLKAILTEIKEIAKFNWSDKHMGFMCNQILQKISEVVENE